MSTRPVIYNPDTCSVHVAMQENLIPVYCNDERFEKIFSYLMSTSEGKVKQREYLEIIQDFKNHDGKWLDPVSTLESQPRWVLDMSKNELHVAWCRNGFEASIITSKASHKLAVGIAMYHYAPNQKVCVKSILEGSSS